MPFEIDPEFLELLRCPENSTPLSIANQGLVDACNRHVSQKTLRNRAGLAVERALDGGLVRADGAWLYPVIDGIPILLADEAIATTDLR